MNWELISDEFEPAYMIDSYWDKMSIVPDTELITL